MAASKQSRYVSQFGLPSRGSALFFSERLDCLFLSPPAQHATSIVLR
jgi:hypothetical protein